MTLSADTCLFKSDNFASLLCMPLLAPKSMFLEIEVQPGKLFHKST